VDSSTAPWRPFAPLASPAMETRRLGRTGHRSSVAILGGFAFGRATAAEAEATWQLARDHGVNHLDIAPRYADAEDVVGPLL
jgi:aryl-alcohol dehydrogenase-like predicted oxidoreductase